MTTAATKISSKTRHLTCQNVECSKRFRTKKSTAKYCGKPCQDAARNRKNRVDRTAKALHSAFFYHLAGEVARAGTYQILEGHNLESLIELYALYKTCLRFNNYGEREQDRFQLGHIVAVRDTTRLGLYCASNLVITDEAFNRTHGTTHYSGGACISRVSLKARHKVSKDAPRKQIVEGIIQYLGQSVVSDLVRICKIQPKKRYKLLSELDQMLNPADPVHTKYILRLDGMSAQGLSALKNKLNDMLPSSFTIKSYTQTHFSVICSELERYSKYRPCLQEVLDDINHAKSLMPRLAVWNISREEEIALNQLLHGRSLSDVQTIIDDMVHRNIPEAKRFTQRLVDDVFVGDVWLRIPDYTPITFKLPGKPSEAPIALSEPFEAELDAMMPDAYLSAAMTAPAWSVSTSDMPEFAI